MQTRSTKTRRHLRKEPNRLLSKPITYFKAVNHPELNRLDTKFSDLSSTHIFDMERRLKFELEKSALEINYEKRPRILM